METNRGCILSPGQTIAASQRNISQHYWPSTCRLRPKRSQHLNATDRNIVGRNMLHAFGHPVATCCDMLRVKNRTGAHAWAQPGQTTTTSCNIHKFVHFQIWANNTQHVATHHNMMANRTQYVAPNNVAICCVEMLRSRLAGALFSKQPDIRMGYWPSLLGQDGQILCKKRGQYPAILT